MEPEADLEKSLLHHPTKSIPDPKVSTQKYLDLDSVPPCHAITHPIPDPSSLPQIYMHTPSNPSVTPSLQQINKLSAEGLGVLEFETAGVGESIVQWCPYVRCGLQVEVGRCEGDAGMRVM